MEDKSCAVFVDGKDCGLPLTQVDREAGKIARYDLVTSACSLGHRSYFLLEPRIESQTFRHDPRRDRAKMDELLRKYSKTHDKTLLEGLYQLACELEKLKKEGELKTGGTPLASCQSYYRQLSSRQQPQRIALHTRHR